MTTTPHSVRDSRRAALDALPAASRRFAEGMDAARRPTGPVIAILIVLAALSAGRVVFSLPFNLFFGPDGPDTATLGGQLFNNVVPFAGALLALYLWVRLRERRSFATLGFLSRPSAAAVGAIVAPVMVGGMLAVAVAAGQLTVEVRPVSAALLGGLAVALVGFVIQGSTEDILFRGFLLQAGVRRWGLAAGVGVQAVLFALIHGINPGGLAVLPLLNLVLFAVFLAAWSLETGGLWAACAWHALWNWTQGNVVGLQVSGESVDTALLTTTPTAGSDDLLTGGAFGLEGGILTTGVLLVGLLILAVLRRRRTRSVSTPRTRRRVISVIAGILALPVIFALMIVWHECGHTVAAWLVGDLSARFELVDLDYPCVGCNLYDSVTLGPAANAFVNVAGVIATQVLAWTAAILLVVRRWGLLATWLLVDVLIVTLADVVWQCIQPFLPGAEVTAPLGDGVTYVDGSAIVVFVNHATGIAPAVIVGSLLAVVSAHLVAVAVVLTVGMRRRRTRSAPLRADRSPIGQRPEIGTASSE